MEYYTFLLFYSFLNSILLIHSKLSYVSPFYLKKKKSIDQSLFEQPNQKISKRIV